MDELLTVEDAAARSGVSVQRVRLLCKRGRIPGARRFGRDWLIPLSGLDHWRVADRDRRTRNREKGTWVKT